MDTTSPRPFQNSTIMYGAALVSAGGWGAALGYGVWPLGWGAFLPLWAAWYLLPLRRSTVLAHAVGPALLAHAGAYLIAYPWLFSHATSSGTQAGIAALVLLASLYSLPLIAGALLAQRKRLPEALTTWIGGWMLVDLLMQYGPWAFPWVIGAHAVVESPGTYTLTRLGGPVLLTLSIGIIHAVLLYALIWIAPSVPLFSSPRRSMFVFGGCAAGMLIATFFPLSNTSTSPPTTASTVWAVQPALPPLSWSEASNTDRRSHLIAQTEAALDTAATQPDLIVWPETALHPPDTLALQARVDRWSRPLLAGAVLPTATSGVHTNTALLLQPTQTPQHYDKRHLVPFVEFVPGATWWEGLYRFQIAEGERRTYVPGNAPQIMDSRSFRFLPLVCFESLFGGYVASLGSTITQADGIITIAQTDWWNGARPARQHLHYSRLRAMETGRPLLLSSVSGPTAMIAPSGRITTRSSYGASTVTSMQWPPPHPPGAYVTMAPYTNIAWTVVAVLLVGVQLRRFP